MNVAFEVGQRFRFVPGSFDIGDLLAATLGALAAAALIGEVHRRENTNEN